MFTIAVLDDSEASLEISSGAIVGAFKSHGIDVSVTKFNNPIVFLNEHRQNEFSLYFFDIDMPEKSGVEVALELRKRKDRHDIIFVSSFEEKVFECFAASPFGFVRKDKYLADLTNVIKLYVETKYQEKETGKIFEIKSRGERVFLDIGKIIYAEGNKNYQVIHRADISETYEVRIPMAQLEEKLAQEGFIRIHKGFLVNYRFIRKFSSDSVILSNEEVLPLGRQKKEEVMKLYLKHSRNSGNLFINK